MWVITTLIPNQHATQALIIFIWLQQMKLEKEINVYIFIIHQGTIKAIQ